MHNLFTNDVGGKGPDGNKRFFFCCSIGCYWLNTYDFKCSSVNVNYWIIVPMYLEMGSCSFGQRIETELIVPEQLI